MKVICDGLDLSIATNQVIKALSTRTTNFLLEGIKFSCVGDEMKLSCTDLELGIEKTIKAEVKEEGETVIPGKFFADFIKKLTSEKIELDLVEKNKLKISYTDSETFIQVLNAEEFPNLEMVSDKDHFVINSKDFKNLINRSIFSCAIDDSRPILKGCLLEVEDDYINSIGLDGYRLAFVKEKLVEKSGDFKIVVPSRSLSEICKFLEEDDRDIKVCVQRNFLMVQIDSLKIITRLIDGDFINYKQIIPSDFATSIVISKNLFEEAIERTSILSRIDRNNLVKFEIKDNVLTLLSNSDLGNIKENIAISLEGNDLTIAFNSRYFTECLRTLDDEAIKICFNNSSNPCVIRSKDSDEYLYLILPVRIISHD